MKGLVQNLARRRKKFRTLPKIRCLSLRYVAGDAAASPFSSCRCCSGVNNPGFFWAHGFHVSPSSRPSPASTAPGRPSPPPSAALLESTFRSTAGSHHPYVSTRNRSLRRRAVRPSPDSRHVGPSVREWANPYRPSGRIYPDGHLGPDAANARARGLLRGRRRHARHAGHAARGEGRPHAQAVDRPRLARAQARFRQLRHFVRQLLLDRFRGKPRPERVGLSRA